MHDGTDRAIGRVAPASSPFFSPKELAARWRCSRSSVDRIARRGGIARLCLGTGRNGMVRYARADIERFESSRRA